MLAGWRVCPSCGESTHKEPQPFDGRGLARVRHAEQVEEYHPPLGEYLRTVGLVFLIVFLLITGILVKAWLSSPSI